MTIPMNPGSLEDEAELLGTMVPALRLRDTEMGPDMLALNARQRAFVFHMVEEGGLNATRAAALAGYKGTNESLRVMASRMVHDNRIAAAMLEEAKRRLHSTGLLAVSELYKILASDGTKTSHKLQAISMVLNRVGMPANQTHTVQHQHTVTDAESVQNIAALAAQLGLDPQKLLGSVGITIDGTARELSVEEEHAILHDPEEEW